MSNPPLWGRDTKGGAPGLSSGGSHDAQHPGDKKETRHVRRSLPKFRPQARTQHAIDDAQQGLRSLLTPQTDDKYPHIISPSGATRSHRRGRVAGPAAPDSGRTSATRTGPRDSAYLPEGKDRAPGSALSVRPGSLPALPAPGGADGQEQPERTRLGMVVAEAAGHVQTARERAMLLINEDAGGLATDSHTAHASRRAASQWVSRYATHLVIVLVVAALAGVSGLKTFTVQSPYPHGLAAVDAYTGTDQDGQAVTKDGKPALDSQSFELVLPRTQLAVPNDSTGAANPANQSSPAAPGPAGQNAAQGSSAGVGPRVTDTKRYTVVTGDTIQSIASKFKLMPETVMGSNGLFDSEQDLAVGQVLLIPPIDAMYYVAAKGDTIESIAQAFQVEPAAITGYQGNNLDASGAVREGQPLLVPGGMMPERWTTVVYTVKRGDILKDIAARFGVDVPTMIDSNDIPDPDNLQPGTQLRVLPVPGVEYKVQKGDTVKAIAEHFGVTPQMILDYSPNHLAVGSMLKIDQVIMVPGGTPPQETQTTVMAARVAPRDQPVARGIARPPERQPVPQQPLPPAANPPSNDTASSAAPAPKPAAPKPTPKPTPAPVAAKPAVQASANTPRVGTGRLMWPVNGTITQYFTSYHNGLDIAISAGTPIHAADAGKVIWSGWRTDGLGYCVMIDHLNGLLTVYGHMIRQPAVYVGQYVDRGQVIGYIGSTGHSTGPHVHFMVKVGNGRNYQNPLAYLGG